MKYEEIKDLSQRCEEHPDHQTGMISGRMIEARLSEEIDELRAYIEAKQEQGEPVAEVKENPYCPEGHSDEITKYLPVGMKLYTTPQQRKPLTDEQKAKIVKNNTVEGYHGDYYLAFGIIDDVEAAHGIKE